jgi:hypothetical protein
VSERERERSILAEKIHHDSRVASSVDFHTCSSSNATLCSLILKQFNDDAPTSAGMGGRVFRPEDKGIRLLCSGGNWTTWHHITE